MSASRVTAKAVVNVTVEVSPGDVWGEECTIAQARSQGAESAMNKLARALTTDTGLRIVGKPKVTVVTVVETDNG